MKRILFTLGLLTSLTLTAYSQVIVDGVNINDLDIKYIKMTAYTTSAKGNPAYVTIDYGEPLAPLVGQVITGPDKDEKPFKSVMAAYKFMEDNGWQCESKDAVFNSLIIYIYYFKRSE